jgi:hypothetical protein
MVLSAKEGFVVLDGAAEPPALFSDEGADKVVLSGSPPLHLFRCDMHSQFLKNRQNNYASVL